VSGDGDLENFILSVIERWSAGRYTERHGLVTSYDPKNHLAKVVFMPEGQESGWLPIETGHVGDGFGVAIGLAPGDGKSTGDQVIVRYQEGDFESGKIVQRVHSDNDKPPTVQSGEVVIWTKFQKSGGDADSAQGGQGGTGQQIYLKNDGTATVTDGNGATIQCDGKGNVIVNCKSFIVNASQDAGIKDGNNAEIKAGSKTGIDAGSVVIVQGKGDVSGTSVTPPSPQPDVPPFEVPA
jgi:phage baseplate assembly protein gpV